ncbi:biopolymer transporter ExbD [Rhodophyticola sp. CCM32]|uniref:biopolymer transporter ExbD n=1 Tax=Rhodophyticola sp. CCM32 TaxID=2916397 RepID=UPI00143D64A8|nr:biopolymer transporter ExbD [Rhodophyticola sp. CCM32]
MQFGPLQRRRHGQSIVPMINLVFLLLIFFLMTAQIAPPEPFPVTPPEARADPAGPAPDTLYIATDGMLAYETARDAEVFEALRQRPADAGPLAIRADADLQAAGLAELLPRLAESGIAGITLIAGHP